MNRNPICIRTKEARENAGIKAVDMAEYLDITYDAYNKYETRSAIRPDLISPFCTKTEVSERWLLTGAEDGISNTADDIHHLFERIEKEYGDDAYVSPILQSLKAATIEKNKK